MEGTSVSTYQTPVEINRVIGDDPRGLLRLALRLDAGASGAVGLLALVAAPALDGLLGTPRALLGPVGLVLVAYATLLWIMAVPAGVSQSLVWAVIVGNGLWVVASAAVVAAGWLPLTGLGVAVVLAQAAAVALVAALQLVGLRRARPAAP
jgi:hypothetical protein